MSWVIRPPTFKSPGDLAQSVWDDANTVSAFYLKYLFHHNPGLPFLTFTGTFAGFGYYGARAAGLSAPVARSAAMFAFRRGVALTIYSAPVTVPYYIGRNISRLIDPIHGESRYHYAIANPIAASTETVINFVSYAAQKRYGTTSGGGGGF